MNKIFSALLSVTMCCLFFSSCASITQMRDRAIIEAVGIDYKNGEYTVSLKEHAQSENTEESIIKSSGKTLFDALKNAEASDGKQIFYGHSGIFLIGKGAALNGMQSVFDFMNSNYQISLNASVLCCDSTAEKIITLEEFSKNNSNFSIDRIEQRGKTVDVTVIEALKTSYNLGGQFVLPIVEVDRDDNIKIENCVIFKENKPKTILNSQETMGLNLLLGNICDGVFVTKENEKSISVNVVSQNCDIDIVYDGTNATANINVSAYGNVSEFGTIGDARTRKAQLINVESDVEKQIKETILSVLEKTITQKQCDILYLAQRIKKSDERLYRKIQKESLENTLSKIKFNIIVDFSIRHSGIQVK